MSGKHINETDKVYAPWTPEQVDDLRAYQTGGIFHELTCINGHGAMEVEEQGLRCLRCGYVQEWVPWICISAGHSETHPRWWEKQ